jgi:DNA-binding HxlR family transcriptional regulator
MRMVTDIRKNAPGGKLQEHEMTDTVCRTCEVFAATQGLKRLSGLWKTPVMLLLLQKPRRFGELERQLAPISAKVLTTRLKELEEQGLVRRDEIVSAPPKTVIYSVTSRGETLRPVMEALAQWHDTERAFEAEARVQPV